jgi:hypothetical protein
VHLFWSSHEEERPWLELSMGGGHGRTSSSMTDNGELAGEGRNGEGDRERGAQLGGGAMGRGC